MEDNKYINYKVIEEVAKFADIERKIQTAQDIVQEEQDSLTVSINGRESGSISIPISRKLVLWLLGELKADNDTRAAIAIKDIQNGRAWSPVNEKRMWSK